MRTVQPNYTTAQSSRMSLIPLMTARIARHTVTADQIARLPLDAAGGGRRC